MPHDGVVYRGRFVPAMDKRVRVVLSILDREFSHPVPFDELASLVGVGRSRLEHLFKAGTDTSMRNYVRHRRLQEAARLLTTTRMRVGEIAKTVGFMDAVNFTHAFTETYGMSPRAYRAQTQQFLPSFDNSHQE